MTDGGRPERNCECERFEDVDLSSTHILPLCYTPFAQTFPRMRVKRLFFQCPHAIQEEGVGNGNGAKGVCVYEIK